MGKRLSARSAGHDEHLSEKKKMLIFFLLVLQKLPPIWLAFDFGFQPSNDPFQRCLFRCATRLQYMNSSIVGRLLFQAVSSRQDNRVVRIDQTGGFFAVEWKPGAVLFGWVERGWEKGEKCGRETGRRLYMRVKRQSEPNTACSSARLFYKNLRAVPYFLCRRVPPARALALWMFVRAGVQALHPVNQYVLYAVVLSNMSILKPG